MIELTFRSADGPILIQILAPVPTPEQKWPWAIEVRTNGRSQTLAGDDPLQALEMAAQFASSYLSGREGLEPPVEARAPFGSEGDGE